MSQKTKLRKIFITIICILVLGSIACRKNPPDPTPVDSGKSMSANLLIISSDGLTNINSIPLRFANANATLTSVTINDTNDIAKNIDKTNFIFANNTLKLTNIDLSTNAAAVSNLATLTFSLVPNSSSPLTSSSATANIYIGKEQTNISTNALVEKLNGNTGNNHGELFSDAVPKYVEFYYDSDLSSNNYLVFINKLAGQDDNLIAIKDTGDGTNFYSSFNKIISDNWQSFADSYTITTSIEDKTNGILTLQFEPTNFYKALYTFKFVMKNGEWVNTNGHGH